MAQPAAHLQVIERFLHGFRSANFIKWPVEKRLLSIIIVQKERFRKKIVIGEGKVHKFIFQILLVAVGSISPSTSLAQKLPLQMIQN